MYNFTSIGAGVGGTEATIAALYSVIENLRIQKAEGKNVAGQSYSYALVDESAENIPGGVGFGREMSHFGDFNNPIRLSPNDFVGWVLNNKTLISSYIEQYGGLKGQKWLDTYGSQLEQALTASDISELYLPRAVFGYFMEERLLDVMDVASKAEAELGIIIKVDFWQGVANGYMPSMDGKGGTFTFGDEGLERLELVRTGQTFPKLRFEATGERQETGLETERANISLGIAPPQQLATTAAQENQNYLWDFYAEGGTQKLLERIRAVQTDNPERQVTIHFLGSMAGLLESLPELEAMRDAGTINVKLISSSSKAETLQKAEFTAGKPAYQLAHFTLANASQFSSADAVLDGVREEFKRAKESGYGAYDAWTPILMGGVLNTIISKLSDNERERYDSSIHPKLREISRFTNPETVLAKESLESKGVLVMRSGERATGIEERNGQLVVKIDKDTGVAENMADIVVNVSGPLSPDKLTNISPLIRALSEAGAEIAQTGIKVDDGFQVKGVRGISLSGTLAEGYNPNRQTIINAILNNARVIGSEAGTQIANQNQEMVYSGGVSARKNVMNAIRDGVAIPPREDNRIIVIDGLSGSGKSTLARVLAEKYDLPHFDSGYILKAAAKKLVQAHGSEDETLLLKIFEPADSNGRAALVEVINSVTPKDLADTDLDHPRYSTYARQIASNGNVRFSLNEKIKEFGEIMGGAVITGRDTGSRVYGNNPDAIKIFLEVSMERAVERKVSEWSADAALAKTETTRRLWSDNFLPPAGSIIINTDAHSPSEVAQKAIQGIDEFKNIGAIVPPDELGWELFRDGSARLNGEVPQQATLDNRLVAETNNFFAIVGLGAFVPYLLIIPKDNIPAIPNMHSEKHEEFQFFRAEVTRVLRESFGGGKIIEFEHGGCACLGADHAHIHYMLLPKAATEKDISDTITTVLYSRNISGEEFIRGEREVLSIQEYLQQGNAISRSGGHYVFLNFDDKLTMMNTGGLGSQFGRHVAYLAFAQHDEKTREQIIAEHIRVCESRGLQYGGPDITNSVISGKYRWQANPFPANIVEYMHGMVDALNEIPDRDKAAQFGYKPALKSTRELDSEPQSEQPLVTPIRESSGRWNNIMPAWAKSALAASLLAGAGLTYFFSSNKPDGPNQLASSNAMSNDDFADYKRRYYEFKDHVSKLLSDLESKGVTDEGFELHPIVKPASGVN